MAIAMAIAPGLALPDSAGDSSARIVEFAHYIFTLVDCCVPRHYW